MDNVHEKEIYKSISYYKYKKPWFCVVKDQEKNEWCVVELIELPDDIDLTMCKYDLEEAITMARTLNSNERKSNVKFIND